MTKRGLISRVLVAVDGSEYGERAFESAMNLAKIFGSKVFIIHVIYPPAFGEGVSGEMVRKYQDLLQKGGENILASYIKKAENTHGLKAETILATGYPSQIILDATKDKEVDLIVMGSRGLSGIKELFLGSVSHTVVRKAKIPVLIIK